MQEPDSSFGYPAPPRRSYIEFGPQDRQSYILFWTSVRVNLGQANEFTFLRRHQGLFAEVGLCKSTNYANEDHQDHQMRSSHSTMISDPKIKNSRHHHPTGPTEQAYVIISLFYLSMADLDCSLLVT